jgi:predicted nuclease of predicted toxin-antitoxin system
VKFLVDQNSSIEIAVGLRDAGYDAVHTVELDMKRSLDTELLEFAREEDRIIITKDKGDFATTLALENASSPSIILMRPPLSDWTPEKQFEILTAQLTELVEVLDMGACVTIRSPNDIRVRALPFTAD